ncbi:MAG: STAS domain-containing protein [Pseudomonadota bacterium]
MSACDIVHDNNTVRLSGRMGFDNVNALIRQADQILKAQAKPVLDLSQLSAIDSAGLALLCLWKRNYPGITFQNMPNKFDAIIKVSGLYGLICVNQAETT